jgi:hypothetical protein
MQRHAFNDIPYNSNNVGLHTFVHGEELDLKIKLELKKNKNLSPQEIWENNNV